MMRRRAFVRRMAFAAIASGMLGSELLWRRRENESRWEEFTESVLRDMATALDVPFADLVEDYKP